MKKGVRKQKLNVKVSHSRSMKSNLFESLMDHGKVETTLSKAKVLKSYADGQISYAFSLDNTKVDNSLVKRVSSVRIAEKVVGFVGFLKKQDKKNVSGFTTLVRTRYRKGDNSLMVEVRLLGYVDYVKAVKSVKKLKKSKKPAKAVKKPKESVEEQPKKEEKKEVKKQPVKKIKPQKRKEPEIKKVEEEKRKSLFTKLSERFLGRGTKGPEIERKGRARSRSGI